ncbi:MAG TPA: cytochrome c oxidase subunit II [Pyrinomonadaceae bacterium]|nr:cytochrome c oxidase subunit II [Pyrinomonadaceae bacterium]
MSAMMFRQSQMQIVKAFALLLLLAYPAQAQSTTEQQAMLRDIRIEQRLDAQVSLNLTFSDETGRTVQLNEYFGSRPVILVLAYYDCPMLCTLVLNGLTNSLTELKFNVGQDFNIITVSFDPREKPELAAAKKEIYVRRYGRAGASAGWHFLTGDEANIKQLADAVGFHYAYDPETGQFAHASGIMLLTPEGKVSRYFYGIEYPPRDLRLGLVEASNNKIGSLTDQVLLLCYHYDIATGKYAPLAVNAMRIAGALTVAALAFAIFLMLRKERKRRREKAKEKTTATVFSSHLLPFAFYLLPLMPESASTEAHRVDSLFYFLLGLCGFVATGVIILIIYFAIKYRRRTEDQLALSSSSPQWVELSWTIIPLLIFIGIFIWGARVYFALARPPENAIEINVVAKQWMWKFQHPEGQREINELHVPVNRPVKLTLVSEDVIHSFFVPAFRIHQDVLPLTPGRPYRTIWFEATETGRFHLFCSQYCGTQHSGMIGEVIVMEPRDYERWLASGGEGSLASMGQKLFRQLACNECHSGNAQARGPSLDGLYGNTVALQNGETVRADENYLRESILNPRAKIVAGFQPIMPTFQNQLDEEQVLELIAYIKSLGTEREQVPPVSQPAGPQPSPVQGAIKQSESRRP